ncbi:MAG: hypothetical protein LIO46_04415 [Clostridiales bacterium]|nr:hypothetical protein [Clostridiales bacterium]
MPEYLRVDLNLLHDAAEAEFGNEANIAVESLDYDNILQYAEIKYLAAQQAVLQKLEKLEAFRPSR